MIVLLIALFCLFFLITIRDVRYRLVYGEDLLMLVSLRMLAAVLSLYPDESGLQAYQWGFDLAVCEEEQNLPLCPGIGVALLASDCSVGMG